MTIIKAIEFISSGLSEDDARALAPIIYATETFNEEFIVDFSGVQEFTELFFCSALTHLVGELGEGEYQRRLHVINLSDADKETYIAALEYSVTVKP